jgi:hypothetical protein
MGGYPPQGVPKGATAEDVWNYVIPATPVSGSYGEKVKVIPFLSEVAKGTKTADGTEQDLVSTSGRGKYEGWIDLANMQAGDTVIIREYIKLKSGGSWRLYTTATYTDVQTEPAIHATRKLSEFGWRVTLQQTAGVYRDYDYEFFKEG